jgi:hypothetical protein
MSSIGPSTNFTEVTLISLKNNLLSHLQSSEEHDVLPIGETHSPSLNIFISTEVFNSVPSESLSSK